MDLLSLAPWGSPFLLVPKSDGTARFCTDYRKVNAVTIPDFFYLSCMEDCVDNLGSARYVSKLDLLKGYWQVPLPLMPLIFQTLWLPIVFTVLCYGFRDTQSTCYFPATHYCAFRGFKLQCLTGWSSCVFYKLVRTCFSVKDCIRRSRQCFIDFELGKVWIWPSTYLGKELGQGQVRPLEAKVTAIAEFLITTTGQELRWFFVMAGYYCSFCNNFSIIVQPLTVTP